MSGLYSYNVSVLFSSLGNNSSTNTTGINMLAGLDLNTLSSIRNGSYRKLLNAYYDKTGGNSDVVSSLAGSETELSKTKVNAANVRDEASALSNAVEELNKSDLWKKKKVTAEDGSVTEEYDKDAIYKAVSSYAEEYNLLIDGTGNSENTSILRTASNMVSYTKANRDMLKSIGITIGTDNKLTVDEDTFKNSSMAAVKSAFTGAGSYGKSVQSSAAMIYGSAVSQLAKLSSSGLYSGSGSYSYISGSIYNRFL